MYAAAKNEEIEQKTFRVQVTSYDIECAVMDAFPPEDSAHLDCLAFTIKEPKELEGKSWYLYIHNNLWGDPIDYGYKEGDILEIDASKFGMTIAESINSTEAFGSPWIPNDLIKKVEQGGAGNLDKPVSRP